MVFARVSRPLEQQREAGFYRSMVTGERFFAEYFHVGYYGTGFPEDVRVCLLVTVMVPDLGTETVETCGRERNTLEAEQAVHPPQRRV